MRFYCPGCWSEFEEDLQVCPHCGLDIYQFWKSKDWVEKLVNALHHPEPSTPLRAAWLLGRLRDPRCVSALMEIVKETKDIYLARTAIRALGEIGGSEVVLFLRTLAQDPAKVLSEEARETLRTLQGGHQGGPGDGDWEVAR